MLFLPGSASEPNRDSEVLGGFEGCGDFFTAVVGSVGWWDWISPALCLRMKHGLKHSRILSSIPDKSGESADSKRSNHESCSELILNSLKMEGSFSRRLYAW